MADSLVHKYLTNVTKRFYVDRKSNCNKTANIRMHIDLGHHIIMGLGDSLARLISPDRLAFIRLRRNRTSTAISFYSSQAIPCGGYYNSSEANLGHGMFVLCPWDHGSIILQNDDSAYEKWEQLTDFQRCLWYVDEVEARWQMFIQKYPDLVYLETDPWNTGADLMNILSDSATFLEGLLRKTHRALGSVHVLPKNTTSKGHAHTSAKDYLKDRSEEIKQYTSIMAYSSNVKKLLQGSTTDNYN
jgi:hypothetical protein